MNEILRQPSILLFLTLAAYALAIIIRKRTGNILFNPVLISTVALIAYLKILNIDYAVYHNAAQFIDFWLKPAVVVLAVPLYQNRRKIFNQWLPVIVSQLAGSITGIVTGMYFAKWLGAERDVVLSLASKSVTNPIAIEITRSIGGLPPPSPPPRHIPGPPRPDCRLQNVEKHGRYALVCRNVARHGFARDGHCRLTRTQPAYGGIRWTGADAQRRTDRTHRPVNHTRFRILNPFQTAYRDMPSEMSEYTS